MRVIQTDRADSVKALHVHPALRIDLKDLLVEPGKTGTRVSLGTTHNLSLRRHQGT